MAVHIQDGTTTNKLKVNADGSLNVQLEAGTPITIGSVDQGAPNTAANGWPVKPTDGTNSQSFTVGGAAKIDGSATTQPISASTLPLPTGAATATLQGTGNTSVASIDTKTPALVTGRVPVDGSAVTQPISATVLPLPTGASTSALQTSGNASVASIDTKTPILGQALAAGSVPVVLTAAQLTTLTPFSTVAVSNFPATQPVSGTVTANAGTGTFAVSAAALPLPTGAATSASQTTMNATLSSIDTKTPSIGQTTQALSSPVVNPGDLTSSTGSITIQDTGSTSTVQSNNQTLLTGSPTATSTFSLATNSYNSAVIKVSGTWTGSIQIETSSDGGTSWIGLPTHIVGGSIFFLAYTANVQVECNLAGKTNIRVRAPSAITGTVSIQFILSYNPSGIVFVNNAIRITDGANSSVATPLTVLAGSTAVTSANTSAVIAISPNSNSIRQNDGTNNASTFANIATAQFTATTPGNTPFVAAVGMGWDGATHREVLVATDGTQQIGGTVNIVPLDGNKATYSAAVTGLTVAAAPTDIFTITGSATKTIRITRISFTGSETTATQRDVVLLKRSAANTGGTSTTQTNVPHDSTSAAGTATIRSYTVNPTGLGALVGALRSRKVFIATTTTNSDEMILDFGDKPAQALVIRGTGEVVSINLNSVASAGSSLNISVEWTEES